MVQNCGAQCSKFFLIVFNVIFFICGVAVLGIGIWIMVDGSGFLSLSRLDKIKDVKDMDNKTSFQQIGTIMCIAGGIVFVISFLGCCGAIKQWRPLLVIYALFLIVILGLEVAAGIYAAVESGKVEKLLQVSMKESLSEFFTNNDSIAFDKAWKELMKSMKCCGAVNSSDFKSKEVIPEQCCNETSGHYKDCQKNPSGDLSYLYSDGCYDAFVAFLKSKLTIVIGVGIGIGLVQIFGIIFAFCLCSAIGSEM